MQVVSAAYLWDSTRQDVAVALTDSLFGDGCAAAILRCDLAAAARSTLPTCAFSSTSPVSPLEAALGLTLPSDSHQLGPEQVVPELLGFESLLLPGTLDALQYTWDETHHKYSFTISADVPYLIGHEMPQLIARLLSRFRLEISAISHWCVHSGGKKVLDSVVYSLGLSRHDVRHTLSTLHSNGNMSSASFLWSYQKLLAEGAVSKGQYGVFITMGPGAAVESALCHF